jgi:hypothetical protein
MFSGFLDNINLEENYYTRSITAFENLTELDTDKIDTHANMLS